MTPQEKSSLDTSEVLEASRLKRKWQIALRRYAIEGSKNFFYAPYFALDVIRMREWLQAQLPADVEFSNFGKKWQLEHVMPVSQFMLTDEADLRLCWNFTNIRAVQLPLNPDSGVNSNLLLAKKYFQVLFEKTGYEPCLKMLQKISIIENAVVQEPSGLKRFFDRHHHFLEVSKTYTALEFSLLNEGRTPDEIKKDTDLIRKFET